jgi:lysophospholipase L1-like esterase
VLNQGISGAVLSDRMGVNAWARFDRDALSLSHADTVILMLGINDIGATLTPFEDAFKGMQFEDYYSADK